MLRELCGRIAFGDRDKNKRMGGSGGCSGGGGGLKMISGERAAPACEDMKKDAGVGKLLPVPMNSESHESSPLG